MKMKLALDWRNLVPVIFALISAIAAENRNPPTFQEVLQKYADNTKRIGKEVARLEASFKNDSKACNDVEKSCPEKEIPLEYNACYMSCATRDHIADRHLLSMARHLTGTVVSLCGSILTIMDDIFQKDVKTNKVSFKFQSYKDFQYLLGISASNYVDMVKVVANGLGLPIIENINTPYKPLRVSLSYLRQAMVKLTNNFAIPKVIDVNPNCTITRFDRALDLYAQGLKFDTAMESTLIPGYFLITTVSRYINAKASFRQTVLMEIARLFTGSVAGFGCSTAGMNISSKFGLKSTSKIDPPPAEPETHIHDGKGLCDELGKEYFLGFPVPPIVGNGIDYTAIKGPKC